MTEEMIRKEGMGDLSKGALIMLMVSSIGWLFITVNAHDGNIKSLNDRSDIVNNIQLDIKKLETIVSELEKSVASSMTTLNQIEPQWRNLGLLRETISKTREKLSSMEAKMDRNTSDVKVLVRSLCKGKV